MTEAAIEVRSLSKWFGEVVAINNLDLGIGPGVTGLLGPNGAGKTTFIKVALGLYRPSRGSVRVFGEAPRGNLDLARRVAYCPESDRFYDNMTGYEFIFWMNRYAGMDAAAARKSAEDACARMHMSGRMHDLIATYSRGMRQRINLAQALSRPCDLLFLDEPLAGLDPEGREEMFALIRTLGSEGRTVVVSSHILYEIERVTNSMVLLHKGRIVATGEVRHIRDLIDGHPHAVTIECRQARTIAEHFVHDEATLGIEFLPKAVTIRTSAPNAFYKKLNGLVIDEGLDVESVRCPDDNLQAVFDYLVTK